MKNFRKFRAVYIQLPVEEWGAGQTTALPLWRVVDTHSNLCIASAYSSLDVAFGCLKAWDFDFVNSKPHRRTPNSLCFVTGVRGQPLKPNYERFDTSGLAALDHTPGPRLLINYPHRRRGWVSFQLEGWPIFDLYAYPVRRDYVHIDPLVLSEVDEIYHVWKAQAGWRERIGDCLHRMVDRGVLVSEAIALAAARIPLTERTLYEMYLTTRFEVKYEDTTVVGE